MVHVGEGTPARVAVKGEGSVAPLLSNNSHVRHTMILTNMHLD